MEDITDRRARVLDIESITRIYSYFVRHGVSTLETTPPSVHEMLRRYGESCHVKAPFLVALFCDQVIGFVSSAPYGKQIGYRYSLEYSMFVVPEFQARGVGRLLMSSLVNAATREGFRSIIATVFDEAPPALQRLHERFGFMPVGTLKAAGFKHGRLLDVSLHQRPLVGFEERVA